MKKTNRTTLVALLLCVMAGSFALVACNGDYYNPNMGSFGWGGGGEWGGNGTGGGKAMTITVTDIPNTYAGKYADLTLFYPSDSSGVSMAVTFADQGTLITTPSMTLSMQANDGMQSPFNQAGTYDIDFDIREGKDIWQNTGGFIQIGIQPIASYSSKSSISLVEGSNTIKWDEFK